MTGFRVGWLVTRNLQLAAVTVRTCNVARAQLALVCQSCAVHGTRLLLGVYYKIIPNNLQSKYARDTMPSHNQNVVPKQIDAPRKASD